MSVLRSSAAVYAKSDKDCGEEFFALIVKPTFALVPVHLESRSIARNRRERNLAKLRAQSCQT